MNLEVIAQIDYHYWALKQHQKTIDDNKPKNGIEAMIDQATGFGDMKEREHIDQTISHIEEIIKLKKQINEDYSYDEKFLNELEKLK